MIGGGERPRLGETAAAWSGDRQCFVQAAGGARATRRRMCDGDVEPLAHPHADEARRDGDDDLTGCIGGLHRGPRGDARGAVDDQPRYAEIDMDAVTVSPKYQVVIPRAVRDQMHIRPGEKLQVISFYDRIELVRTRPIRKMRGFLKGLDRSFRRDKEDRI